MLGLIISLGGNRVHPAMFARFAAAEPRGATSRFGGCGYVRPVNFSGSSSFLLLLPLPFNPQAATLVLLPRLFL